MNPNEFSYITAALQTAFPWANLFPTPEAMDIWYGRLKDIPYSVMQAVVNKWLETQTEPPTIASLRAEADLIVNGAPQSWGDAWEKVRKAIGRYGFLRGKDALATFDELTRRTVENIGWQQICESENPDALRANFRMCYETMARRQSEERLLTAGTRQDVNLIRGVRQNDTTRIVSGLADHFKLTKGETE